MTEWMDGWLSAKGTFRLQIRHKNQASTKYLNIQELFLTEIENAIPKYEETLGQ